MPLNLTAEERIAKNIVVDEAGCWIWQKHTNPHGYGKIRLSGRSWLVHRLAYTLLVGPIPEGLTLDHLCRVRSCCNPSHLEPVDQRTNAVRGEHPLVVLYKEGRCKVGHVVDENNSYRRSDGRLRCAECTRKYQRDQRANAAIARHQ
jgi:HNH endonuclease